MGVADGEFGAAKAAQFAGESAVASRCERLVVRRYVREERR